MNEPARSSTSLLAAAPAAAVFLLWVAKDGGFDPTVWLPSALFLLALTAMSLVFVRGGLSRTAAFASASLAAFAAWSALSVAWAGVAGIAWDGANRTVLYLLIFLLFVTLPWTAAAAVAFTAVFATGVAAIAAARFIQVADHPSNYASAFRFARLATPISYPNATCAVLLMAAFASVVLSSRREMPVLVRGAMLGVAGVSAELALATQSRASFVAAPIVLAAALVLIPGRLRLLLSVLSVSAVTAASAKTFLDLYTAVFDRTPAAALAHARTALFISVALLFVVGTFVAMVDARVVVPARASRVVAVVLIVAAAAGAVVGVAVLAARIDHPIASAEAKWQEFKTNQQPTAATLHAASGIGSGRYDIWRVALDEFRRKPVLGVGSDNFAVDYLRHRRTLDEPLYPHSVELRSLSQTGVVGFVLFIGFLAAAVGAVGRGLRRSEGFARVATIAAFLPFLYWLVHGTVDWFWEIPALGGPALAFLGLSVRLATLGARRPIAVPLRRPYALALGVLAAAAAASLALPWIAAKEVAVATAGWSADPGAALQRLDLAARLNPLSDPPDVVAAVIARRSGDPVTERSALRRALARNDSNWYAWLQLALLDASTGHRPSGLSAIARARRLNPKESVLVDVEQRLEAGKPISAEAVDRSFTEQQRPLTGASQG